MPDLSKGPFDGFVVERDDPESGMTRVRAELPGVIDDLTNWLYPLGVAKGEGKGNAEAPDVGASVAVWFVRGNPDNGRYFPGHWAQGKAPSGAVASADGDHKVYDDGVLRVERDEREDTKGYRLKHSPTDTLLVEFDANTMRMKIVAPTSVNIESTGEVKITAGAISLNGRTVLKTGEPI